MKEVTTEKGKKANKKCRATKKQREEKATDVEASWPQNRMDDSKSSTSKIKSELFPFEKL